MEWYRTPRPGTSQRRTDGCAPAFSHSRRRAAAAHGLRRGRRLRQQQQGLGRLSQDRLPAPAAPTAGDQQGRGVVREPVPVPPTTCPPSPSTWTPPRTATPAVPSARAGCPTPRPIRPEEFVNSFRQDYAAARRQRLRRHRRRRPAGPTRERTGRWSGVGLADPRRHVRRSAPPAALTFVVDVSGSMAEPGRLDLVKRGPGHADRPSCAPTTRSPSSPSATRPRPCCR